MNTSKKGQVTIFIIIGVVIVASVILFFILSDKNSLTQENIPEEAGPVNELVKSCLEETLINGIYENSLSGGYYDVPDKSIDVGFFSVPFYFEEGVSKIPSKNVLEEELSNFVRENIDDCIDFQDLREQGYNFSTGNEINIETEIVEGKTRIEMDYLINIGKGDVVISLDSFQESVGFDYLEKYEATKDFVELQKTDPEYIFMTKLDEMGEERGFNAELIGIQNSSDYFYNFVYPEETNKNQTYVYSFAVRY